MAKHGRKPKIQKRIVTHPWYVSTRMGGSYSVYVIPVGTTFQTSYTGDGDLFVFGFSSSGHSHLRFNVKQHSPGLLTHSKRIRGGAK